MAYRCPLIPDAPIACTNPHHAINGKRNASGNPTSPSCQTTYRTACSRPRYGPGSRRRRASEIYVDAPRRRCTHQPRPLWHSVQDCRPPRPRYREADVSEGVAGPSRPGPVGSRRHHRRRARRNLPPQPLTLGSTSAEKGRTRHAHPLTMAANPALPHRSISPPGSLPIAGINY